MGDVPEPLVPLREEPESGALFLDYDGTLAPIVDDPEQARPLPGVAEVLERLCGRLALVAVVSGRPAAFLQRALGGARPGRARPPAGGAGLSRLRLIGLYGLEEARVGGAVRTAPEAERWRPLVAEVAITARNLAPEGLGVEPKGLSVTLHWRPRPDAQPWALDFAAEQAARTGLVLQPGRMAVELRPPAGGDKGTVVQRLAAGYRSVGCFGDDLGDLAAFRALSRLAEDGVAVARVAVSDPGAPPEVLAAADVVVVGPEGALALLRALAGPG